MEIKKKTQSELFQSISKDKKIKLEEKLNELNLFKEGGWIEISFPRFGLSKQSYLINQEVYMKEFGNKIYSIVVNRMIPFKDNASNQLPKLPDLEEQKLILPPTIGWWITLNLEKIDYFGRLIEEDSEKLMEEEVYGINSYVDCLNVITKMMYGIEQGIIKNK
jgi:hypothetical protein